MPETSGTLIIGGGGREHALGNTLHQQNPDQTLYFAPGNGGTAQIGTNLDIPSDDIDRLVDLASERMELVVVGPEVPLAHGIIDALSEAGVSGFGPSQEAAQLEASKAFAARFLDRHGIPAPASFITSDPAEAAVFFQDHDPREYVIKADGLAAGKGVILPDDRVLAQKTIQDMMVAKVFGEAGHTIVIQERLTGREVSVLAFTDGKTIVPMLPAQDYKRAYEADRGPNTGGMGVITPVPFATPEFVDQVHADILQPTIDGMRQDGHPFKGILYAGLMLTDDGPKVLEYNVRFGDPETQALLPLLSTELAPIITACINGSLKKDLVSFRPGTFAACVVLASGGYPGRYKKGIPIMGLDRDYPINIYQAGTALDHDQQVVTNGGRVLNIVGTGGTLQQALEKAYRHIGETGIHFDNMHYRQDIGSNA
jgi:phosphoribosylamine--glycine ligase